jgi:hypothetical protein
VKERFEDYEQMLQYYTLMRTKNNMKDSNAKSKEWWEVAKELEKNLAQHRVDERNLMYKLEIYQKKFLDFIYGTPASIKASCQDEEIEIGPNGIAQEEEVQIEEPHDLRGGGQYEKEPHTIQE